MNTNEVSEITRKALNILFVANPKGTSLGIFIGVLLDGLIGLFSPLLKSIQWLSISAVKTWHLIGLGVFSMNLPSYLRRKEVDPSIKNAIAFIESEKEKGNIAEWQARQMYVNLHTKVLESVALETDKSNSESKVRSLAKEPSGENESNK
tara:strand:- start:2776 stop:3225 length:450 start_codon:yes stop_codon:yes gene_type:complete